MTVLYFRQFSAPIPTLLMSKKFSKKILIFSKKCLTKPLGGDIIIWQYALVAQLDRVLDYESRGQGFESLPAHHKSQYPFGCWLFCLFRKGTRTREGCGVKKTVWYTVFSRKSLSDSESQSVCKA